MSDYKKTIELLRGFSSTIEAARRQKVTPPQPAADSWSVAVLKQLMDKITFVKGDKGDKGDPGTNGLRGPVGFTGKNGIDGKDGRDGIDGEDGKDGKDGLDGTDGVANMEEVIAVTDRALQLHNAEFDHKLIDPFLIGAHRLDESNAAKGRAILFDGEKYYLGDLPKQKTDRGSSSAGRGASDRFRIRTVTTDSEVDIHDQIIHVDASAGDLDLTFYTAVSNDGRHHYIKRVDNSANIVTLVFQGAETWEFELTDQLPSRGSGREPYAYGGNWFIKSAS